MGVSSRLPDFCCFPLISPAIAGTERRRQLITLPFPFLPVCLQQKKACKFPNSPLSLPELSRKLQRCVGGGVEVGCALEPFAAPAWHRLAPGCCASKQAGRGWQWLRGGEGKSYCGPLPPLGHQGASLGFQPHVQGAKADGTHPWKRCRGAQVPSSLFQVHWQHPGKFLEG